MYSLSCSYTAFPFLRLGKAQCTAYQIFYSFPGGRGGRRGNAPTLHRLVFFTWHPRNKLGGHLVVLFFWFSKCLSLSLLSFFIISFLYLFLLRFLLFPFIPSYSVFLSSNTVFFLLPYDIISYFLLFISYFYIPFLYILFHFFFSFFFLRLQLICLTL